MRASTKHKFVYLANPKCASTSFRKALQPFSDIKSRPRGGEDSAPNHPAISNHSTAKQVRDLFLERGWGWDDYFVFTTIRNPWSKVWSTFNYGKATPHSVWHEPATRSGSLLGFINSPEFAKHSRTIDAMTKDGAGNSLVHMIIKVEAIPDYIDALNVQLGFDLDVGHLNRGESSTYVDNFDEESKKRVAEIFESDIEVGKYKFA